MGRPLNKRNFGAAGNKLAVKFYSGGSVVTGYIVKQTGSNKFLVSKSDGSGQKECRLAQTAAEVTAMGAGDLTLCTIEVAIFGGATENAKKLLSERQVITAQGSRPKVTRGVAGAATGEGTIAVSANVAPTVANAIANQVGTVAGAFSYDIPANTFADLNGDTLTLSATTTAAAALSTIGFAFSGSTLSKAAGASTVGAKTIIVTASDGALTVTSTFTVTLS